MKSILLYIISVISVSLVWGQNVKNDTILCCPPTHVVLMGKVCWERKSNITIPIRLKCSAGTIKIKNFTVISSSQIEVRMGPLYKVAFDSDIACAGPGLKSVNESETTPVAVLCLDEEEEKIIDDTVLGYCMLVSAVFLPITAFTYAYFGELRDLFGKSIINFCASFATGLGILAIMNLTSYSDMDLCAVRGFLTYFFMLAAFFWSNSIAIQVLRDTRRPFTLDYSWREFKWYMLYSWGVPTVLTVCMAVVNFHPGEHQRPGIGLNHCWFISKEQQWYYMYSVMSILLFVNVMIFIYISSIVWRHTFSSSHIEALKFKFYMSIRLIVLMGLPWIFEMIGTLSQKSIIWVIMDILNCLQGIFIFLLLVVFRKKVIKLMYKRGYLPCVAGLVEKYVMNLSDAEENVIEHTELPTHEENIKL